MKDDDETEGDNSNKQSEMKPSYDISAKKAPKSLANSINTEGLTDIQKTDMANREKDKGNEV